MTIKPKMFLNASPQTTEQGSLVYASNIKIDSDGNIVTDYGYDISPLGYNSGNMIYTYEILGHIIGLNDTIYFLSRKHGRRTTDMYTTVFPKILAYDEKTKNVTELETMWSPEASQPQYSTFSGAVTTNISGEIILTIAEVPHNSSGEETAERIPLKHINLSYPTVGNQSLYCQAPKIPLLNLLFNTTYSKTIPNGTYVFFVRYKIRDGVFTKWYLASRPCFAGTSDRADTLQGGVEYINIHRDSANSFVFDVEAVYNNYAEYYEGFQVGFIITHDEGTDARIWKYFDFSYSNKTVNNKIYFDYEDVQEANIDDLLEPTYEIYNVKNVTVFKNQLYISNYIESEHNVDPRGNSNVAFSLAFMAANKISIENNSFTYTTALPGYNTTVYTFNKLVKDIYTTNTQIDPTVNVPWNSILDGPISTSYSNIVRESEKTFKEAFSLVVGYDLDINPDIATVYDIKNNLKNASGGASVFPASFKGNKYCAFKTWEVATPQESSETARYKWRLSYGDGDKYTIASTMANDAHPFYNSNSFYNLIHKPASAYGCIRNSDVEHNAYKLGVTSLSCTAYPISSGTTYAGSFTARNEGFNKETKVLIVNHVKDYITQHMFNNIMCIELYCGTESYILDNYTSDSLINKLDEEYYVPRPNLYGIFSTGSTELTERGLTPSEISNIDRYLDSICSYDGYNHLIGLTYAGELVFDIGKWYDNTKPSKYIKVNTIKVKLRKFKFDVEQVDLEDNTDRWYVKLKADCKVTDYAVICNIGLSNSITYNNNTEGLSQRTSLIPFSTYNVYMHNVDEHGIISDGYLLETIDSPNRPDNWLAYNAYNFKLKISNTNSYDYNKTCFLSIISTGNIVARCFDYNKVGNDHYISCIELDSLLLNENNNLSIYFSQTTGATRHIIITGVEYLSSGNIKPAMAFGNCGLLHWTDEYDYSSFNYAYLVIDRQEKDSKNKQLLKFTPYFNINVPANTAVGLPKVYRLNSHNDNDRTIHPGTDINDCFYPCYVCNVRKPSFELSSTCYAVGNEVYAADRTVGIKLTDFEGLIQQSFGSIHTIISPFNLNYLSLTQDLKDTIFKVGSATSGVKQVVKILDSATLSYIYELKSMYRNFMNVYFRPLQDNYKTVFDNTVRVSNVLSDETFNNDIYRFGPTDYYNIPTNRGKIVKLFSIGMNIYAHTLNSFYKFDGSQMLVGNNTDIQLKESEPFDAGITQLFDSEYGYGGIAEKSASCVTFDSYFFYDNDSNHIFAYKDNQPVLIDGSIRNFLDYVKNITSKCTVLPDIINNRVFFNFRNTTGSLSVTLSYNYKSKCFVSIHDLSLQYCFSSKQKIYYCNVRNESREIGNNQNITVTTTRLERIYKTGGSVPSNLYGEATKRSSKLAGIDDKFVIGVILYPNSNITEVLNYVKYIGSYVRDTYTMTGVVETRMVVADYGESEGIETTSPFNPVQRAYILTDRCKSNIIEGDVNDTDDTAVERQTSASLANVKGFKFDKGTWNFNYFRNILHQDDDFKYYNANGYGPEPNGYKQIGNVKARSLKSDYNSLIYGRYFIIVLALKDTRQVKMEEIFISTEKY